MSIMCWNCRGMGNPWSVRQLRKWSVTYAPDIIFLSETMIKKNTAEEVKHWLGFPNAFGVDSRGRSGGLCIYWQDKIKFSLVSFSQHHICGDVDDGSKQWRFVGVYGWPNEDEKHRTWTLMRHIFDESSLPLLFGGDFNEILCYNEKQGGVDRTRREVENFRALLDDLSLRDLGYVGQWHT